jgi:hypothetical protein
MYPALPKSYKGLYQFRLGTTSFIYPDHYLPNVKMLGPYLNEMSVTKVKQPFFPVHSLN